MRRLLPCALLALAGCDSILDTPPRDDRAAALNEIESRQDQWTDRGIHDYDFDYVRLCTCDEAAEQPVTIQVRGDDIAAVLDSTGAQVPAQAGISWPTFDSLFVWARDFVADSAYGVEVLFDPTNHFPTRLRYFLLQSQTGLVDHTVGTFVVVSAPAIAGGNVSAGARPPRSRTR